MNNLRLLMSLLVITLLSGCAAPVAKVDFDQNTEIATSHYKTFVWLTDQKILASAVDFNPVMKARIDKVIEAEFISKGYQLISDESKADFAISYSVGDRDQIQVTSYPVSYNNSFRWGGRYHRARYNDVFLTNETHVKQYTEGKLAIDIYDAKSQQPVWHGWATKRLTKDDKESPDAIIQHLVQQVLAQF